MSAIQLDTGFLICALVAESSESSRLRAWLREGRAVGIAAPAWAEFLCGPVSGSAANGVAQLVGEPVPFGGAEAERAAALFNASGRRKGTLMDCMIAACAIESGGALATNNSSDFQRFERMGLTLA